MNNLPKPKLLAVSQLNEKCQMVIPKEARESIGVGPGDRVIIALAPFADALVIARPEEVEKHLQKVVGDSEDLRQKIKLIKEEGAE